MKGRRIQPVILAGGLGLRLCPLSSFIRPKPFLPLANGGTLLRQTARRVREDRYKAPIVSCLGLHHGMALGEMAKAELAADLWILEPFGRDTAAAIALAAQNVAASDPDRILAFLPADHEIRKGDAFHEAVERAAAAAREGYLSALGVKPEWAETDYGYIQPGETLRQAAARRIARFIEKPHDKAAARFCSSGRYLWNSGIFVGRAESFVAAIRSAAPAVLRATGRALRKCQRREQALMPHADSLAAAPKLSFDRAVMEKIANAAVLEADMGWRDCGTWKRLGETASFPSLIG